MLLSSLTLGLSSSPVNANPIDLNSAQSFLNNNNVNNGLPSDLEASTGVKHAAESALMFC